MVAELLVRWYSYALYLPLGWVAIAYGVAAIRHPKFRLVFLVVALLVAFCVLYAQASMYSDTTLLFPWYLLFVLPQLVQARLAGAKPPIGQLDVLFFGRGAGSTLWGMDGRLFFLGVVAFCCATVYLLGTWMRPCEWLDLRLHASGCYATFETFQRDPDVFLSPDGQRLAISGEFDRIEVMGVAKGDVDTAFDVGAGRATSIAWSSDGRLLAAGTDARTVLVWDVAEKRIVREIRLLTDSPIAVAFAPGLDELAVTAGAGPITIWRLDQETPLQQLTGHAEPLLDLRFSPDGRYLAAAGENASWVYALDGQARAPIQVPGTHIGQWALGAPLLVTWDYNSVFASTFHGAAVETRAFDGMFIKSAGVLPDGRVYGVSTWLVYKLQTDRVWFWDTADGSTIQEWQLPRRNATHLTLSPDGSDAVIGVHNVSYASQIQLWHVRAR